LWRIHELDPENRFKPGELRRRPTQMALDKWLVAQTGIVAELAREELAEIMRATPVITALEKRIMARVQEFAPSLLELYGCAALNAGRIVGETAAVSRFRNEAAFARYAGLAPVPNWSGSTQGRMRSHRGGNRQLNAAIHQIAMIQIKKGGPAETYYRRRRAERDLHGYALDGVKRRVARTVFNRLCADQQEPHHDAIIADLARRADEWAALIPPQETRQVWPTYVPPLPHPDPIFAQMTQIADDWEAQVASFSGTIAHR
jgi:transposase